MKFPGQVWLLWGAILSFAIALFHILNALVVILLSSRPDSVTRQDPFVVFLLGGLYFLFGLYALSGGGVIRKLPLLDVGLAFISVIYTLWGLRVFPETFQLLTAVGPFPVLLPLLSLMFLVTGCVYAVGTVKSWKWLRSEDDGKKDKGAGVEL
jgi:hypothetical protein